MHYPESPDLGRLIPIQQSGSVTRTHWTTVARWGREGRITVYKVGGRTYVDPEQLLREIVHVHPRAEQ